MSIIPVEVPTGAIRYNTDSNKMECFNGTKWMQVAVSSPDLNGGARGLFCGGWQNVPSPNTTVNNIDYITIATAGDSVDFGDLTRRTAYIGTASSRTRGVIAGGRADNSPTSSNTIEYVTIASTGDAINFGDLPVAINAHYGNSNQTRGVFASGYNPSPAFTSKNEISVLTIASTGDAIDGGDLPRTVVQTFTYGNATRGIWGGGYYANSGSPGSPPADEMLVCVNLASTGNSFTFGNLAGDATDNVLIRSSGLSNSVRGVRTSGYTTPYNSTMDVLNLASLGSPIDFGDVLYSREWLMTVSSPTRGVMAGGDPGNYQRNREIQYFEIATGGTCVDFGDLTDRESSACADGGISNAHGGL